MGVLILDDNFECVDVFREMENVRKNLLEKQKKGVTIMIYGCEIYYHWHG